MQEQDSKIGNVQREVWSQIPARCLIHFGKKGHWALNQIKTQSRSSQLLFLQTENPGQVCSLCFQMQNIFSKCLPLVTCFQLALFIFYFTKFQPNIKTAQALRGCQVTSSMCAFTLKLRAFLILFTDYLVTGKSRSLKKTIARQTIFFPHRQE